MSQIGSSSGVRVAAQPLSNVYTVLLLVGAAALVLALVLLCIVMDRNYGVILPLSDAGKANQELPAEVANQQESRRSKLKEADKDLKRFPEGISASAAAPSETGAATTPEMGGGTAPGTGTAEPADAPAGN